MNLDDIKLNVSGDRLQQTAKALNMKKEAIIKELIDRELDGAHYTLQDLIGRLQCFDYANNPSRGIVYVLDETELVEFFPISFPENFGNQNGLVQKAECRYRILLPCDDALRPCRTCGSEPVPKDEHLGGIYYVDCPGCFSCTNGFQAKENATYNWNKFYGKEDPT